MCAEQGCGGALELSQEQIMSDEWLIAKEILLKRLSLCPLSCRSLGVHCSKVRSLTLDSWEPELLKVSRPSLLPWRSLTFLSKLFRIILSWVTHVCSRSC